MLRLAITAIPLSFHRTRVHAFATAGEISGRTVIKAARIPARRVIFTEDLNLMEGCCFAVGRIIGVMRCGVARDYLRSPRGEVLTRWVLEATREGRGETSDEVSAPSTDATYDRLKLPPS
jgi:hypothetical protein